jgi:hypothetical protein
VKSIIFILFIIVLLTASWLIFRPDKQIPSQATLTSKPTLTTNISPQQAIDVSFPTNTNTFIRPDYIDKDHWNQLMLARQMALQRNQLLNFYARVVDQDEQPVEGAKLKLTLTYLDEDMFKTTNFFQKNIGDEVAHKTIELSFGADGWIQLTNTRGYSVDVRGLSKEGYLAARDYYGGELYEPNGTRRTFGDDILMTNFYNAQTGYTFHLQKN